MTIPATTNRADFSGSGSTGPFSIGFELYDQAHLLVVQQDNVGLESTLTLGSDYTFTSWLPDNMGRVATPEITLTNVLPTGNQLACILFPPGTQLSDFKNQESFFASSHEAEYDLIAQKTLQLQGQVDASVRMPIGEKPSDFNMIVPPKLARANKAVLFDGNGNVIVGPQPGLPGTVPINLTSPAKGDAWIFDGTNWVNQKGIGPWWAGTLTGTSSAYIATIIPGTNGYGIFPGAYYDGMEVLFKAPSNCNASATLAVKCSASLTLAATPIRNLDISVVQDSDIAINRNYSAVYVGGSFYIREVPVFKGSGTGHREGLVPDPGASGGTTKFLREDGSFQVPAYPTVPAQNLVNVNGDETGGLGTLSSTTFVNVYNPGFSANNGSNWAGTCSVIITNSSGYKVAVSLRMNLDGTNPQATKTLLVPDGTTQQFVSVFKFGITGTGTHNFQIDALVNAHQVDLLFGQVLIFETLV